MLQAKMIQMKEHDHMQCVPIPPKKIQSSSQNPLQQNNLVKTYTPYLKDG
jgi:hypothetical protein